MYMKLVEFLEGFSSECLRRVFFKNRESSSKLGLKTF